MQIEDLLKAEIIHGKVNDFNLLDFVISEGPKLARLTFATSYNEEAINKLITFKLINKDEYKRVIFNDDGHKFYLKSLVLAKS